MLGTLPAASPLARSLPIFMPADFNEHHDVLPIRSLDIAAAITEAGIEPTDVHHKIREGMFVVTPMGNRPIDLVTMKSTRHFVPSQSIDAPLQLFFEEHGAVPVGLAHLLSFARYLKGYQLSERSRFVPVDCGPERVIRYKDQVVIPVLEVNNVGRMILGLEQTGQALRPGTFLLGLSTLPRR